MSYDVEKILNPRWRLNNLYHIKTKASESIIFNENKVQKKLNNLTTKNNKYIILKARQFGISTNEILKIFDKTIFNFNTESCILSHERDSIERLFKIVLFAYEGLPEPKPRLAKGGGSKYELEFPGLNSRIYVDLEVRSGTVHNLHVSELAFFKDRTRFDATTEAVPMDGHISIETTPNGMNFFYDMWNDPNSEYEKIFFPWYEFDDYVNKETNIKPKDYTQEEIEFVDKCKRNKIIIMPEQIAFRRNKQNTLKEMFAQEYPEDDNTCFLSSGNPYFNLEVVKKALESNHNPIKKSDTLTIYEDPIPNRIYVAGADTAEGVGSDFNVMTLFDARTQKQVLTLRGQWRPRIFADRMYATLKDYLGPGGTLPLLGIERNNHGHAVLLALENLGYSNLFTDKDGRNGWLTNSVSKPIMLNAMKDFIETSYNNIRCKHTLLECLTFVNNNGKINSISGKHDDCVIATAIALQMLIKESATANYDEAINSFFAIGGRVEHI